MKKKKNYTITLLLAFFLGELGAHKFYTGDIVMGIIYLFSGGGCGILWLIDLIKICFNKFRTIDEQKLDGYNPVLGTIVFIILIALIITSLQALLKA